jgi:excisionase family DNA binding protein
MDIGDTLHKAGQYRHCTDMSSTQQMNREQRRAAARRPPDDARTLEQIQRERPWATERYLRRLIFEKRVSYFKVGRRVLISLADLDELVASGRIEARR